jgi:hypothetical protein
MKNSQAKSILINQEGCKCLLTGYTVEREQLTFHHIEKKEHGGQATPENGANLLGKIHEWLHNAIEHNNLELFILINECLLLYKEAMRTNNAELIRQFEEECQPLFQEEYDKYSHDHPVKVKVKNKKEEKMII